MSIFFDDDYDSFNYHIEKKRLIDNLEYLKSMTVEEQTLYKKWIECRAYKNKYDSAFNTKSKIWVPSDLSDKDKTIQELRNLKPSIRLVEKEYEEEDWLNLRLFVASFSFDANPGRLLKYLLYDEVTEQYLGVASLGSDVTSIRTRDVEIGWNNKNKFEESKLNSTAICPTIVSVQPFGYNFLGGKLTATMLCTKTIQDDWKRVYGDTLVGLTTTSLYGQGSMYNGIPFWKSLGESAGKVYIRPDDVFYDKWHNWLKENKSELYHKSVIEPAEKINGPITGIKQKIIMMIFKELEITPKDYIHGYKRGVYFAKFYENYKEYLRSEIDVDKLIPSKRLEKDKQAVLDWWRTKAEKRYLKLFEEGNIKSEFLYYSKIPFMTWEETKEMFLSEMGR